MSVVSGISIRHLIILILMVYVSALNIVLVNSLFGKYLVKYTSMKASGMSGLMGGSEMLLQKAGSLDYKFDKLQKMPLKTLHEAHTSKRVHKHKHGREARCSGQENTVFMAIVPGPPNLVHSNDMASHRNLQILSELRHVLRNSHNIRVVIYIFLSADTFLASHRTWCQMIPTQINNTPYGHYSPHRVSCTLALLPTAVTHTAVFEHMLHKEECLDDMLLLHDDAHVSPSFFSRIESASRRKVTCLASLSSLDSLASSQHGTTCPIVAFRLPRVFMVAWVADDKVSPLYENLSKNESKSQAKSIEDAAQELHLWGGAVTAVGVG